MTPYVCPLCNGVGKPDATDIFGFSRPTGASLYCHPCKGTGVVWLPDWPQWMQDYRHDSTAEEKP